MSIISASTRKSLSSSIISTYSPNRDRLHKVRNSYALNNSSSLDVSLSVGSILLEVQEKNELKNYENLLYRLSQPDIKDDELLRIIRESSQSIPLIKTEYSAYIETLFNIRWISRNETLVEEFHNFIVDLLATKNEFLRFVLSNLIGFLVPSDLDREFWMHGNPSPELQSKLAIIHKSLKRLLEVIPMISQPMLKQLKISFPYYKKADFVIVGYVHNLLWILDYFPNFKNDILRLIFEKITHADTNVSRAAIEETEIEDDSQEQQMFEMDNFSYEDLPMKHPVAQTLDLCMEKLMDYFHKKLHTQDPNKVNTNLLETVLVHFDAIVLQSRNTQHIQFLIFYVCSFQNQYTEMFLSYLWRKLTNINVAANIRVTAISYLSSFLARAKYIPIETLKLYLGELCNWAHQYTQKCDAIKNHVLKAHTVFYAICQAIFYIVAFRSRDLTTDDNNLMFMQSLHLSSIVTSQLNPLRVCSQVVATIFAGVTRTYQLAYCHTILERNARRKLATIYVNNNETPEEFLDSVFPFDPYLLKRSFKRIDPLYLPYQAQDEDPSESQESAHESRRRKRNESVSMSMDSHDDFIMRENYKKQKIVKDEQDFIFGISPGFNM